MLEETGQGYSCLGRTVSGHQYNNNPGCQYTAYDDGVYNGVAKTPHLCAETYDAAYCGIYSITNPGPPRGVPLPEL
jgi:hypothetical protein